MANRHLPDEMIVNILTRLPVKSLLRFRCVNKSWCELFRNPSFVKMHHKLATENDNITVMVKEYSGNIRSIVGFDDREVVLGFDVREEVVGFEFLNSYNGLFCIRMKIGEKYKEIFCIWNPSTKEFKKLPALNKEIPEGYDYIGPELYGFGYDCSIEDYKVVKIVCYFDESFSKTNYGSEVLVYTLGSDSWKRIGDIPYLPTTYNGSGPGTHVNGALHWVVVNHDHKVHSKLILSLDLVNEGYLEVPQPDYLDNNNFDIYICELEGCLCVLCNFGSLRLDGWMMKDYGVKGSWSKIFSISQQLAINSFFSCIPMKIFKNGKILVKKGPLFSYDPKNNAVRKLVIESRQWHDAIVYVGSLNSLNSGTYVGKSGVITLGRYKSAQDPVVLLDWD